MLDDARGARHDDVNDGMGLASEPRHSRQLFEAGLMLKGCRARR
jgi:hypothetical protein